VYKIYPA